MIYLDNAATTYFKPTPVINAVGTALKYLSANPTRSSHSLAVKAGMMIEDTRENTARIFNCPPDKVIFTLNCTDALNTAIFGTAVKGGHVITTALEHNSVLRPLIHLKEQGVIDYTVLKPLSGGAVTAERIKNTVGSLLPDDDKAMMVDGSDATCGVPATVSVRTSNIYEVLTLYVDKIIEYVSLMISKLPSEVSSAVIHSGIYLSGGLCKMDGIAEYFSEKLGITVNTFDEPQLAAVIGAGAIISSEHLKLKAATQG